MELLVALSKPVAAMVGIAVHQLGAVNFTSADRSLTLLIMTESSKHYLNFAHVASDPPVVVASAEQRTVYALEISGTCAESQTLKLEWDPLLSRIGIVTLQPLFRPESARKKLGFDNKDRQKLPFAAAPLAALGELRKMFSYAVSVGQPLREVLLQKFWKYHDMAEDVEACHLAREPSHLEAKNSKKGNTVDRCSVVSPIDLEEHPKKAEDYLDFDDLLEQCDRVLQDPHVCQEVAKNCEHVLVDEYQDTDLLQGSILKSITSGRASPQITVVGDDAQGIYGFRGADITNIRDFEDTFEDVSVFKLEENYRSHQKILDLANSVMSLATEGYRKTLHSQLPGGSFPELAFFKNRSAEAQWVLSQLEFLHNEKGFQWRDMAVLFRKGRASKMLEANLRAHDVPYHLVGKMKWTQSAHVRDLVSILQCAFIPRHRLAWKRVLQLVQGVGEKLSDRIFEEIFHNLRLAPEKWNNCSFAQDLSSLADLMDELKEMDNDPKRCVALAREWYQPYFENTFANQEERLEDFLVFEDFVENWDRMTDALEEMNLSALSSDEKNDVVTLSTIHSAKGLVQSPRRRAQSAVCGNYSSSSSAFPHLSGPTAFAMAEQNAEALGTCADSRRDVQ
ncbi:unnamed protein product [Cladocopium goreaui]|uniref:DNA 3'-5' helicase n=1 Tax=Cladocopium goreaui TaxID=2562237 RepID=A0A9P1G296_9DINO|nr:unnamed protein product [Cladocopium goreaui]